MIVRMRGGSHRTYSSALEASILAYEVTGEFDRALVVQRELLTFNRTLKFEEVRRALGFPSPEETDGAVKLEQFGGEVERTVSGLLRIAIDQSLRLGYDHGRIFRLSCLSEHFARSIGMPANKVAVISLAAKVMDVGMMVIPDDLICKPRILSEGERIVFQQHADFSAEILANARLAMLQPCVAIARFHHERWDGTGPCGIAGDAIPIETRILALCDAYESLRHVRPWRQARSQVESLQALREGSGTQFDPCLATRFVDWIERLRANSEDFERDLEAEAGENDYIRLRERIASLVEGS
jgi:putative two-component system response regulator